MEVVAIQGRRFGLEEGKGNLQRVREGIWVVKKSSSSCKILSWDLVGASH
jgi:hypothetical protein